MFAPCFAYKREVLSVDDDQSLSTNGYSGMGTYVGYGNVPNLPPYYPLPIDTSFPSEPSGWELAGEQPVYFPQPAPQMAEYDLMTYPFFDPAAPSFFDPAAPSFFEPLVDTLFEPVAQPYIPQQKAPIQGFCWAAPNSGYNQPAAQPCFPQQGYQTGAQIGQGWGYPPVEHTGQGWGCQTEEVNGWNTQPVASTFDFQPATLATATPSTTCHIQKARTPPPSASRPPPKSRTTPPRGPTNAGVKKRSYRRKAPLKEKGPPPAFSLDGFYTHTPESLKKPGDADYVVTFHRNRSNFKKASTLAKEAKWAEDLKSRLP